MSLAALMETPRAMNAKSIDDYTIACLTSELEALDLFLKGQGETPVQGADNRPIFVTASRVGRAFHFLEARAREFYWTATRLLGLGHLHDGTGDTRARLDARPQWSAPCAPEKESGRILVEATRTHRTGLNTGVQRVTRKLSEFVASSGEGVPFIQKDNGFARFFKGPWPDDLTIEPGDILVLADLPIMPGALTMIDEARGKGAFVILLVYDLIPILHPGLCAPNFRGYFKSTIDAVLPRVDGVIAISACVAEDVRRYAAEANLPVRPDLRIGWSHLGADFMTGAEAAAARPCPVASDMPYFLGVGTLEPRKAWNVAIDAIEKLWAEGIDARLVLVGRYGWSAHWLRARIEAHPEFGKRLVWLEKADDWTLAVLYARAAALVYPSVCEGFGLPLIEARHYGAPIIASDIPIFREIAGDGVDYFPLLDADALAAAMKRALMRRSPPNFSTLDWARACALFVRLAQDMAAGRANAQRLV